MAGLIVGNLRASGGEETTPTFVLISLAVAATLAALPLAVVRLSRPQGWFRGFAWFWTVVTILMLPLAFIGLVFLPLVIGCRRAARTGGSDRTSSVRRPG